LESISGIHEDDIRIPADAFLETSGFGKVHSDKNGLEHLDARSQRMGECGWGSSGGNVQLYSGQDAEDPHGKPRTSYTGWEDSRHFLLESASGGEWTDWRNDAFEYPNEEMDSDNTSLKYGADIRVEYGDLSVDEMNSFFEEENNEDDKDIDTEYTLEQIEHLLNAEHEGSAYASYLLGRIYMCGNIVAKNLSEAIHHFEISSRRGYSYADYRLGQIYLFEPDYFDIDAALEHLNRSAKMGNEYAAIALQRIAENSFLAITTNVLDLIKGLSSIEYREPIKDCTTLPQRRAKKKWEQTM